MCTQWLWCICWRETITITLSITPHTTLTWVSYLIAPRVCCLSSLDVGPHTIVCRPPVQDKCNKHWSYNSNKHTKHINTANGEKGNLWLHTNIRNQNDSCCVLFDSHLCRGRSTQCVCFFHVLFKHDSCQSAKLRKKFSPYTTFIL